MLHAPTPSPLLVAARAAARASPLRAPGRGLRRHVERRNTRLWCRAQVGRKATGEFRALCDKDFLRIGLRK
jgi:hypothetical protein